MEVVLTYILDHWTVIAGFVGATYAVARVAVATTKTEKDDKVMDRLDRVWLLVVRILAKIYGLRPDEGRK